MELIDRILPYGEIFVGIIIFSGIFLMIFGLFFKPKTFAPSLKSINKLGFLKIFYFPIYPIYWLLYRSSPKSDDDLTNFTKIARNIFIIMILLMILYVFVF